MTKERPPITAAVRALREAGVTYTNHFYKYQEHGGTEVGARELGVDEHTVIKTLVMEDDHKKPLIVLMHGDLKVSTKELARQIGTKSVVPCSAEAALHHTGYVVGGISPFGTRKKVPVYMEETIVGLPRILINGGKRGYLVEVDPTDVVRVLQPTLVAVGTR